MDLKKTRVLLTNIEFNKHIKTIGKLARVKVALAKGAGAEWKNGLAGAIIGGLVSPLILTLVVVPVMYSICDTLITKFSKRKQQAIEKRMVEDYGAKEFHEAYEEVEFDPHV